MLVSVTLTFSLGIGRDTPVQQMHGRRRIISALPARQSVVGTNGATF